MTRILVILTLALGPLQWISVVDTGALVLKPVHLPFFTASGLGWLALLRGQVLSRVARPALLFAVPYFGYLLLLMASVIFLDGEFATVAKYALYFLGVCGWFFLLATMERRQALAAVFWGSIGAAFLFFAVAFLTLQSRGINLFAVVGNALSSGDTSILQFVIFRNLFNESAAMTEDAYGTALRHTSLGFVFIAFIVSLACWDRNQIAKAGAALSLLIILISVSRSQWLAAFLALIPLMTRTAMRRPGMSLYGIAAALIAAGWLTLSVDLSGIETIIEQRFGSLEEDGRIGMYGSAFDYIATHPIFGYGAGYEIGFGGAHTLQVHNIFLGAWVQIGLPGLFMAIGFTGALVWLYVASLSRSFWSAERTCLTGLIVLPVFRSQLSGGGGNYTLPEWICIALFLALAVPHGSETPAHRMEGPPGQNRSRTEPSRGSITAQAGSG
jgi:O-antigen ligase